MFNDSDVTFFISSPFFLFLYFFPFSLSCSVFLTNHASRSTHLSLSTPTFYLLNLYSPSYPVFLSSPINIPTASLSSFFPSLLLYIQDTSEITSCTNWSQSTNHKEQFAFLIA